MRRASGVGRRSNERHDRRLTNNDRLQDKRIAAMKVGEHHYRSLWLNEDGHGVDIIDQRWLPHEFRVETLHTLDSAAIAIRDMWVRGAPLIGATAAYGMALA